MRVEMAIAEALAVSLYAEALARIAVGARLPTDRVLQRRGSGSPITDGRAGAMNHKGEYMTFLIVEIREDHLRIGLGEDSVGRGGGPTWTKALQAKADDTAKKLIEGTYQLHLSNRLHRSYYFNAAQGRVHPDHVVTE